MKKYDYFIKALNSRAYAWPSWIYSIFATVESFKEGEIYPYQLHRKDDGWWYVDPDQNNALTLIDDVDSQLDVFTRAGDAVVARKGDLPNITKNVESNYGSLFFNAIILTEPFKDIIDYIPDNVRVKDIESIIAELLTDDRDDGVKEKGKIYVSDYTEIYGKNFLYLLNFIYIFAPSASPKNLTGNPKSLEYKNKRLKEIEALGKLNDKAEIARLGKELIEMDKEWLDDYGRDFHADDKLIKNARLKMHGLYGIDGDFGDSKGTLVANSLSEGINPKNFHAQVNASRGGSFARSSETQISGAKVKEISRALQNMLVREDDCGVTYGDLILVTNDNYEALVSLNVIKGGGTVPLTHESAKAAIGSVLELRSPMFCISKKLCAKCVGVNLSRNPKDMISSANSVMTTFLQGTMKKMHDTTIKTSKLTLSQVCI